MADDDGDLTAKKASLHHKEAFKGRQEIANEARFPVSVSGIVDLPLGSRGPRSLYLRRHGDSFGFTLRHFIIYPPESFAETDGRHAAVGALLTPMETIFVRHVAQGGPAEQAGLQRGDRLLFVNDTSVSTLSYSQVVLKIQTSPPYLHLLVVPKEEDVLQKYFSDTAHNPVSNQHSLGEVESRRQHRQQQEPDARYARLGQCRGALQSQQKSADNIYSSVHDFVAPYQRVYHQKSADNLYSAPSDCLRKDIYAEPVINDSTHRPRAQPQVPLYRKMGRRSSDDLTLTDNRLPMMDAASRRRESASSISSSTTDGSKDSLLSCESTSTLTGHETDDSIAMARFKKSQQRKEEFLRRPSHPGAPAGVQKEFHSRAKKLEKPVWPPIDLHDSPMHRFSKPTHHSFQRVKNDIESEREINAAPNQPPSALLLSQQDAHSMMTLLMMKAKAQPMNGNDTLDTDERRNYPPHSQQIVYRRAKQFESGQVIPEDDAAMRDRTSYYKSELARLSEKKSVPNVAVRTKEFENLSYEPSRDVSASSINSATHLRKSFRDSRSLDSSGSNCSLGSNSTAENVKTLPENFSIPIGSKFIHCVPPSESRAAQDIPNDVQLIKTRARSNSTGSWNQFLSKSTDNNAGPENMETTQISHVETPVVSIIPATPPVLEGALPTRPTDLDLISPKRPVRHLRQLQAKLSPIPPTACNDLQLVVRRTKNTNLTSDEERITRRESYLKATECGRMHIEATDFSDSDVSPQPLRNAHRKWRPPLFPSDIQQLRKFFEETTSSLGGSISGGSSSSSASLDREKQSPIEKEKSHFMRERMLYLKITEIDGKRYTDRSWKQVWAVLKGPKLFLFKDRHHQSPVSTTEVMDQTLSNGIDMRGSCVQVADDYTKRKNVLRISSVLPCRSEVLLQVDSTEELAEWVQVLQQQVATDVDVKSVNIQHTSLAMQNPINANAHLTRFPPQDASSGKQQAVPQTVPAATSVQVPGKTKLPTFRNRSPTGQSPLSKTRKPSNITDPSTSPKSKTWRARVTKQFRRIQHGSSAPSSPTAPEGSTFGNHLELCLPSNDNPHVPKLVEVCTEIVENQGLEMVGIYRVPGNNAAVTALTDEVNKSYEEITMSDQRWGDVHVVSSLLKSFFRKMPDSLLTTAAYPHFIEAANIDNYNARLEAIRRLIRSLPPHHYHTLRHLILHLKNVVDHSDVNKMDAKNVAIVFGPTIVRTGEENMQKMVSDMSHQCKIVESLILHADWFFSEAGADALPLIAPVTNMEIFSNEAETNAALKDIINKVQNKEQKQKSDLIQSLFSAAQKKYWKKPKEKDDPQSPTSPFSNAQFPSDGNDLNESTTHMKTRENEIAHVPQTAKARSGAVFNYKTDEEEFRRRVENFIQETQSNLTRARKSECNSNNSLDLPNHHQISSSSNNLRHSLTLNSTCHQQAITKTNSASNVFGQSRIGTKFHSSKDNQSSKQSKIQNNDDDVTDTLLVTTNGENTKSNSIRRGSSVENIANCDVNANGKKLKYENEFIYPTEDSFHRTNSFDSLNKMTTLDDGGDLVATITKIFDEKKRELNPSNNLKDEMFSYIDDSPEKLSKQAAYLNKENIPSSPILYRNPSLHKSQYCSKLLANYPNNIITKEKKKVAEKDEDSSLSIDQPDNDKITLNASKKMNIMAGSKLRRSESLNKPERTVSPLNYKLKRSESLNKANDRLKRSDSLTKNEKTENNLKKREINGPRRKDLTKLKRKNGMPDRSIKRRHTVGGYPDKNNLLDNRCCQEEQHYSQKKKTEKSLRTSSPDLSSVRREPLFLEVSFIDSENMILSLRQHLIGGRPQSFPESVYKVPLESHV